MNTENAAAETVEAIETATTTGDTHPEGFSGSNVSAALAGFKLWDRDYTMALPELRERVINRWTRTRRVQTPTSSIKAHLDESNENVRLIVPGAGSCGITPFAWNQLAGTIALGGGRLINSLVIGLVKPMDSLYPL